ncbi:MAG TPA: ESX secretion-associated protein EspG [Amycolatopsis sp.]|nr:ESX secretion-associated protein EspG [Amycolatopsis sp.]
MNRFEFSLSTVEASVVGRATGVDIRQFPLRIGPTSADPDRFIRLARQVYFDLTDRRLSLSGELHRFVRLAFELLAAPRVSVAINGSGDRAGQIAVLAVTDGAQALFIDQPDGGDQLWFQLLPDDELVQALVGALPPVAAAPGRVLTVAQQAGRQLSAMAAKRQAEAEFDDEETEAFGSLQIQEVLGSRSSSRNAGYSDREVLEEIMSGPRHGGGYFVATGRTRHGERRSATPVSWVDTGEGRYLVETTTDAAGTLTARYIPGGAAQLAGAIRQMISTVY